MKFYEEILQYKSKLDSDIPDRGIVDKFLIKQMKGKGFLSNGWNDREKGEVKIVNAEAFSQAIFPFGCLLWSKEDSQLTFVDPNYVLAGTYKNYVDGRSRDEKKKTIEYLNIASREHGYERASYVKLHPFPFIIPIEGKNRVSLYRELGEKVECQLRINSYPEPNELELVILKPFNVYALKYIGSDESVLANLQPWQAIKVNKSYVAVLPSQSSVDVLKDYGVKEKAAKWSLFAWFKMRSIQLYLSRRMYMA